MEQAECVLVVPGPPEAEEPITFERSEATPNCVGLRGLAIFLGPALDLFPPRFCAISCGVAVVDAGAKRLHVADLSARKAFDLDK
ncbi:MAG: hypothetical protein KGM44_11235 [bacterium]|nr:hypothetical protein [bacterium]